MIVKRLLVPERVRRPPREGFSWLDRRFLRDHAPRLSGEAIALYLFLVAVSDKDGLSFYSDASLAVRLRLREERIATARDELLTFDLIAFQPPLTQVLALPTTSAAPARRGGLLGLSELFRSLGDASPGSAANNNNNNNNNARGVRRSES
jgi:hypothetical protein